MSITPGTGADHVPREVRLAVALDADQARVRRAPGGEPRAAVGAELPAQVGGRRPELGRVIGELDRRAAHQLDAAVGDAELEVGAAITGVGPGGATFRLQF